MEAREGRHARERQFLRFHPCETGCVDEGRQILNPAFPGTHARRLVAAWLGPLEIGDDQAAPWLQHPADFAESLALERIWQVMHHQGREHDILRPLWRKEPVIV